MNELLCSSGGDGGPLARASHRGPTEQQNRHCFSVLKRCVNKCSTDGGISGSKKNTVAVAARTGRYTAAVRTGRYTVAVAVRTGRQVHGGSQDRQAGTWTQVLPVPLRSSSVFLFMNMN